MTEMPKDKTEETVETVEAVAEKPKPGDPDFDWSAEYPGVENLYTHTFGNGIVVALKPFGSIYSKTWLYKIRSLQTDVDIEFAALDRGACPAAKQLLGGLPDDEGDPLDELFKAWAASASEGLKPGE